MLEALIGSGTITGSGTAAIAVGAAGISGVVADIAVGISGVVVDIAVGISGVVADIAVGNTCISGASITGS